MEWVIAGKHFCNINGNILKELNGMASTIVLIKLLRLFSLYYLTVSDSKIISLNLINNDKKKQKYLFKL